MSRQNTPDSSGTLSSIDLNSILNSKYNNGKPNFLAAAQAWHEFGLEVIPIVPGSKRTAVKWDHWSENLSAVGISRYWRNHPDHELGFLVGTEIIVLDADTPGSLVRLYEIERHFGVKPKLIVKRLCQLNHMKVK